MCLTEFIRIYGDFPGFEPRYLVFVLQSIGTASNFSVGTETKSVRALAQPHTLTGLTPTLSKQVHMNYLGLALAG